MNEPLPADNLEDLESNIVAVLAVMQRTIDTDPHRHALRLADIPPTAPVAEAGIDGIYLDSVDLIELITAVELHYDHILELEDLAFSGPDYSWGELLRDIASELHTAPHPNNTGRA